jgi:hypothetical protein
MDEKVMFECASVRRHSKLKNISVSWGCWHRASCITFVCPSSMDVEEYHTAEESRDIAEEEKISIGTEEELLLRGVVSHVSFVTEDLDHATWKQWAAQLSVVTPAIVAAEGDGEYAFYRNILEEPDFPFDALLHRTAIGTAIREYFGIKNLSEIQLDDAFCVHYNMKQSDTSGAKHVDPSDITANLCIEKSDDCRGSQVLFYGVKPLHVFGQDIETDHSTPTTTSPSKFLVNQEMGYATVHWGEHPHETTELQAGYRTNIVLTYCYTDTTRSDVKKRSCYSV